MNIIIHMQARLEKHIMASTYRLLGQLVAMKSQLCIHTAKKPIDYKVIPLADCLFRHQKKQPMHVMLINRGTGVLLLIAIGCLLPIRQPVEKLCVS